MIQIRKNNIVIPIETWNELKQSAYFKELIEVLEDSRLLEEAKKETTSFITIDNYMKSRELLDKRKQERNKKSVRKNKSYV